MLVNKIRLVAAALVVGSLGSLAACGGGGESRPSTDKIADTMSSESSFGTLSDEVVQCMAKAFHDSDLSDGFLQAMVDKNNDYKPSDEDSKEVTSVTTGAAKDCASDMLKDLPTDIPTELPSDLPTQ